MATITKSDHDMIPHASASGRALETVQAHKGDAPLTLIASWFCPFVQRLWISLEFKQLDYKYQETDPYNKSKEFLALNPRGLVPALIAPGGRTPLCESLVCCQYLEDAHPDQQPALLPADAWLRAYCRIWIDHVDKKVVPQFYRLLQSQEEGEQQQAAAALSDALEQWTGAFLDASSGPYFSGAQISLADVAMVPFALRVDTILGHYRGYQVPASNEVYHRWLGAMKQHPAVAATVSEDGPLQAVYKRYADNTAQSEVARAVRSGAKLP